MYFNDEAFSGMDDEQAEIKRDRLRSKYIYSCSSDDCYMHVSAVDAIPEKHKYHYGQVNTDDEKEAHDQAFQSIQGNRQF